MTVSFVYNHRPLTIPQWNKLDKETTEATSINLNRESGAGEVNIFGLRNI